MKLPRRQFLHLAASATALSAVSRIAKAQVYPTRPVHVIVGFAPAGVIDITARLMGRWLSERIGQPFVIENRPGAGGNIAADAVVRAPPDGHTLLQASAANTLNVTLYDNLNFNFIRDVAAVADSKPPLKSGAYLSLVSATMPARTTLMRIPRGISIMLRTMSTSS
jgi:tripartite-type tricarboxylate transporter receptor subunit TctC